MGCKVTERSRGGHQRCGFVTDACHLIQVFDKAQPPNIPYKKNKKQTKTTDIRGLILFR